MLQIETVLGWSWGKVGEGPQVVFHGEYIKRWCPRDKNFTKEDNYLWRRKPERERLVMIKYLPFMFQIGSIYKDAFTNLK